MNEELVSVVMATYNGERYLRQQLDSILGQTHRNIELIVVDDTSRDRTLEILAEYAAREPRMRICPAEKNMGVIANFERGLKLARSDYIALADQDDIFQTNKIEVMLAELQQYPQCDLVVSDLALIDEAGKQFTDSMWRYQNLNPAAGKPFRRLLYSNFATGCATMFRRRLLQIALPFPADCMVHDWWLAVVAASAQGGGICLVRKPLTLYRQHRANVIGARAEKQVTASSVGARIHAAPRGRSIFEQRANELRPHVVRLNGYLQREGWTAADRAAIEQTRNALAGYLDDDRNGSFKRLLQLPGRLRCAASTKSLTRCLVALYATLWPMK